MAIELRPAQAADVPELGRICYEAFKALCDRHGFPTDFATVEFGQQVTGMLVAQEDVYSIGAFEGGAAKGSNHIEMWDEVAGVGPISVDVATQGAGIGRMLMENGIAEAARHGHDMVRLCQDAFNMQSLALYASLGFEVKEPLANVVLSNANAVDPAFRPAVPDDLPAMDELCRSLYRVRRKGEIKALMQLGFPGFVIERSGSIVGYMVGTAIGHGVAESNADMLALLNGLGATVPDAQAFVPMRNGELYKAVLAAGHRNRKVMNLMAYGPYEEPQAPYCPSVLF